MTDVIRLLHTADWHIGKVFRSLDPQTQAVLQEARLDAIDRMAEHARAEGIDHILVAGDVFDTPQPDARTLVQPIDRMRQSHTVRWHIIPGNHDPQGLRGPWGRVQALGLPDNVRLYLDPVPVAIMPGAWLLPGVSKEATAYDDPTAVMDTMPTPPGQHRIGLAHGSARGFGSDGRAKRLIDPDRARQAGLAYLALGDWHGAQQVGKHAWYSGTPEPDGFFGGGGTVAKVVVGAGAPSVTALPTGHYHWHTIEQSLYTEADLEALEHHIRSLSPTLSRVLVRLTLEGVLPLALHAGLRERLDISLGTVLRQLVLDTTAVQTCPEGQDLQGFGTGALRIVADRLLSQPQNPHAQAALLRLYSAKQRVDRRGM